jgi:hypothetical protein
MKTLAHIHHPASRLSLFLPLFALLPVASAPSFAAPAASANEPKTHTLFMGADIDLKVKDQFCRVRDVEGDSFIVSANGTEHSVPMSKGLLDMKVQQSLKLTEASATIADLKGDRVYTDANDPRKKFSREQPGNSGGDAFGSSAGIGVQGRVMLGNASNATGMGSEEVRAGAQLNMQHIGEGINSAANSESFSEGNNIGNYVAKMQEELDKELYDAMEVTFAVSSEKPLAQPYVVIIARYHEKDANPVRYRNWIFAQALNPVGSKPQKVHVVKGGFPLGFIMDDFKVHLFDRGQELATNVSDKRVELTYADAFRYVMIDYVSAHKGASLPAAPVMGQLPSGWHSRLTPEQLTHSYFIKVSKDGMPLGAYSDEACSQSVPDSFVQSIVNEIRFTPALEKGKAVEGITKLRLGDIRI